MLPKQVRFIDNFIVYRYSYLNIYAWRENSQLAGKLSVGERKQQQKPFFFSRLGHSILFVGLYNPKGPCEEVQVKHTGKNTFTVNYYIRERGEYTLLVMWGENHIPGRPFDNNSNLTGIGFFIILL